MAAFVGLGAENLRAEHFIMSVIQFVIVFFGGVLLGVVFGLLTGLFLCAYKINNVRLKVYLCNMFRFAPSSG